jgi:hypothetical protein
VSAKAQDIYDTVEEELIKMEAHLYLHSAQARGSDDKKKRSSSNMEVPINLNRFK